MSGPILAEPRPEARRPPSRRRGGGATWAWASVPAVATVLVVFILPVAVLSVRAFTVPEPGFQNFMRLLENPGYLANIGRTLGLSALSTFFALLIGYPIAYQMAHGSKKVRTFLTVAIVAPYLTSILLRSFSWLVILGRQGPVNEMLTSMGLGPVAMVFTPIAVVVSLTHYLLPLMILPLAATMRSIDSSRLKAAHALGAGPAQAFVRVYLPLTAPGIQAGSVLCFVYGIGAFVIPALLGGSDGSMLGSLIHSAITQNGDYGLAAAASLVLAVLVMVIVVLFQRLTGMTAAELAGRGEAVARSPRRRVRVRTPKPSGRAMRRIGAAVALLDRMGVSRVRRLPAGVAVALGVLILLPQFIVIPVSFASTKALVFPPVGYSLQWYEEFFSEDWLRPLGVSVMVAVATTAIAVVLGTLAAMGAVRGGRPGWSAVTSSLMIFPLLFPTVVAAAGFYIVFEQLGLVDTEAGIILAHVTIALPFVFTVVSAGLRSLNPAYERAAASLGAKKGVQLRRIVIPIIAPSVVTGALFALLTSFDESTIAIFLSGVEVKTLPRRIYEALSLETNPTVAVITVVVMVCAVLIWLLYATVRRAVQKTR